MSNQRQKLLQKIIDQSSDPDLIKKAFEFADKAHKGQKRESGEDYIIHPLFTAYYLSELKLSPITVAAGFLHDVVDDTPITNEQITKKSLAKISRFWWKA
jgi:GTP pyrophosphokinase